MAGGDIKSNLGEAQQHASALKSAVGMLGQGSTASSDSQTTVAGNSDAQQAIASVSSAVASVTSAINNASGNINSVAKNFKALDDAGSQMFNRRTF
ncbi:TIGR04197 family type VII secretion effector [Enterococcus hulanensis]|uniref:TIGR04197 family type VII secretion effector n=1 Tax=Enterococcus hulanensis TaxID=2559929 RepID=A0ABU3F4U2_9ENTE|nr:MULTISPECIES: TIGR04197 family type VII secretion effector [Enterococcus]MBO0413710.1 TIGR04197 family type VII secretion effector [Enterococcus hulanensis]MBO0455408.1 TIGR04197 family type VII secretion effector [Enterococcus hulanensis]MBX8938104.1 TIGR04197 family type VII secretion effector [Enterococcus gilvus]MDT2602137.1 TIGR04197 family type VII secretion effector [Enterococcus hulanensis]MDT2608432.1 TIGR04197 family type VII secretion effector [Enterococcus hulanensis]